MDKKQNNNGAGLSGEREGLQIPQGGSTPTRASIDYKQKYIELNKALTALKRGDITDSVLEILGCDVDKFWHCNQYLAANQFDVKERSAFIKRLENFGIDLFDSFMLKSAIDSVRMELNSDPDNSYLQAKEMILGNILFSPDKLKACE